MTQEVPFEVIERHGDVELRRYGAFVTADVRVGGDPGSAGSRAFRTLVSYINGRNAHNSSLAMTSPVRQSSEKLAMTAPVLQEEVSGTQVVSFVLPGWRPIAEYPQPLDDQVRLRVVPGHDAAAIRWSGRWKYDSVVDHTEKLLRFMGSMDWSPGGEPVWARYDPPWKPGFLRRNEVLIPLASSSPSTAETAGTEGAPDAGGSE